MAGVKFGKRLVGEGQPCYLTGEIDVNHNGNQEIARGLIALAAAFGI